MKTKKWVGRLWLGAAALLSAVAVLAASGCPGGRNNTGAGDARIVHEQSGGLAGVAKHVELDGNGRVAVASGKSKRTLNVSSSKVLVLAAALEKMEFFGLKDDYSPRQPVAGSLAERIVYSDGRRTKSVTGVTGAQAPPGWDWVVKEINSLAA